jgi:hypothetical protein
MKKAVQTKWRRSTASESNVGIEERIFKIPLCAPLTSEAIELFGFGVLNFFVAESRRPFPADMGSSLAVKSLGLHAPDWRVPSVRARKPATR